MDSRGTRALCEAANISNYQVIFSLIRIITSEAMSNVAENGEIVLHMSAEYVKKGDKFCPSANLSSFCKHILST